MFPFFSDLEKKGQTVHKTATKGQTDKEINTQANHTNRHTDGETNRFIEPKINNF